MENSIIFCTIVRILVLFYKLFSEAFTVKKEEIISVLSELHKISGFRISLHGMNFEEIAAYPEESLPFCAYIHKQRGEHAKCLKSDAEACKKVRSSESALIYKCRYGLTEVICPLHTLGSPAGYLMMGQARDESVSESKLKEVLSLFGIKSEASELAKSIPSISAEKTVSFSKIMTICAEYMTLINALPGNKPSTAELTRLYVYENFREKITMQDICTALGRTKSAICPAFKEKYGTTVMDYLTELRIEEAKKMLTETDMTVSEISDEVGFSDTSYFSKVFFKTVGESPSHYRRNCQ